MKHASDTSSPGQTPNALPKDLLVEDNSVDLSDVSWLDLPVLIVFWVLMAVVMLQFFTRYVLNDSFGWTEEIARYLLILVTFMGGITCSRQSAHIFLEFFYRYLPRGLIKPTTVVVEVVNLAFYGAAGYLCIQLADQTSAQKMVSINWPKGLIYWTVVVCLFAMAVIAAQRVVQRLRASSDSIADEMLNPPNLT